MPCFYPRPMGRQHLPLTPPEYQSSGAASTYGALPYQQGPYCGMIDTTRKNDRMHDFSDRRSHGLTYQPSLPSLAYRHPVPFQAPPLATSTTQYFGKMAPILPLPVPARPLAYDQAMAADFDFRPRQEPADQRPQLKADKAVGGVAVKLDYEMGTMTDFVTEMVHGIIQPGTQQNLDPVFRKWVHQVLCATRLPSATILLSLQFLSMRMTQLSTGVQRREAQEHRQRMLIVALILGSKFLDDNTFINRSWSEVSGIDVKILNYMEVDWFQAMDNRLHRDPNEESGFASWQAYWKKYEDQVAIRQRHDNLALSPMDTSSSFASPHPNWPAPLFGAAKQAYRPTSQDLPEPMQYDAPGYANYEGSWFSRSPIGNSPESMPHTGPTTPEYYATTGPHQTSWEGYSRRTMFGLPPSQSSLPQSAQPLYTGEAQYPAYTSSYPVPQPMNASFVNGHMLGCTCYYCAKSPTNYFLTHQSYGHVMSAAA